MKKEASETVCVENKTDRARIVGFIMVSAILLIAEVFIMDYCIYRMPELIQFIYDKVTLPASLLFVTHFKGVFQFVMLILGCLPAIGLMILTGFGMSKFAGAERD